MFISEYSKKPSRNKVFIGSGALLFYFIVMNLHDNFQFDPFMFNITALHIIQFSFLSMAFTFFLLARRERNKGNS